MNKEKRDPFEEYFETTDEIAKAINRGDDDVEDLQKKSREILKKLPKEEENG